MYGLPVRSVFYLAVIAFCPGAHGGSRQVGSVLRSIRQEAGRLATAVRALNFSAVRVLEGVKTHEEAMGEEVSLESGGNCAAAVERLLLRLLEGKIEVVQMLDATSVTQSGLTYGNIWDFGSYDECLLIDVDEGGVQFVGQHCFIDVQIRFNSLPIIDSGEQRFIGHLANYWFSVCLPSTCTPSSLGQTLAGLADNADDVLNYLNYSVEIVIDDANCHTKNSPPLAVADILGIVVTVLILGVTALCTLVDITLVSTKYGARLRAKRRTCQYVVAFSAFSNGKQLLDTRIHRDAIQGLYCIKFIGIFWISASYFIKMSVLYPLTNTLGALEFIGKWIAFVVLNVPCAVDMFFLSSAMLNTYSFFSISARRSIIGNFKNYLHRYIRLTPAYAVMILVTATWLYRLQSGPLWDILVGDAKSDCVHYWWTDLLYINNYYNPIDNCLFQSWYLAVDMHLFLLAPFVLYCLWRWLRLGLLIIALLVSFSVIVPFYVTYVNEFKQPVALSYDVNVVNRQLKLMYMPTHTNTISYVIGILCGGVLFQVKKRSVRLEINPIICAILWVLTVIAMYWCIMGDFDIYQFESVYNKMNVSLFTATYRLVWSLAMFWIIVACNTGHGGFVSTLISLKMWIPLGRLSYSIFLTHAAVILYYKGSMRDPMYFGYMSVIFAVLGIFAFNLIAALVLYFAVEAPTLSLEKIFRKGSRLERRSKIDVDENEKEGDLPGVHLPRAVNSKK